MERHGFDHFLESDTGPLGEFGLQARRLHRPDVEVAERDRGHLHPNHQLLQPCYEERFRVGRLQPNLAWPAFARSPFDLHKPEHPFGGVSHEFPHIRAPNLQSPVGGMVDLGVRRLAHCHEYTCRPRGQTLSDPQAIIPRMADRRDTLQQNLTEALAVLPGTYPSLAWMTAQASRLLAEEIERSVKEGEEGRLYAPDQFTLSFFPRDLEPWAAHTSQFRQDLARYVRSALKACGLLAIRDPYITLASDSSLLARQVRIIAWHSRDPLKFSKTLPVSQKGSPERALSGAFVVVGGRQHFMIRSAKVTIGPKSDNDLVLEDPHVSRRHAETLLHHNRYVLADLQSTVGTLVNGRPTQRHPLTPGDVMTIAGIQLIYGEDGGSPPGRTSPLKPPPASDGVERITPLQLRLPKSLRRGRPK